MSQKGFAPIALLLLLVVGIGVTVTLVKQPQIFNSQARAPRADERANNEWAKLQSEEKLASPKPEEETSLPISTTTGLTWDEYIAKYTTGTINNIVNSIGTITNTTPVQSPTSNNITANIAAPTPVAVPSPVVVDATACQEARNQLMTKAEVWKNATCLEIQEMVCTTPSVFVAPNSIRTRLCSNYTPPPPLPPPPSSWNLPTWSTMRSNLDRWGNDFNSSNGRWPSYDQWLQAVQQQMPQAPFSFAQRALWYFNDYNLKWGYMFPNADPLPKIYQLWLQAGNQP